MTVILSFRSYVLSKFVVVTITIQSFKSYVIIILIKNDWTGIALMAQLTATQPKYYGREIYFMSIYNSIMKFISNNNCNEFTQFLQLRSYKRTITSARTRPTIYFN